MQDWSWWLLSGTGAWLGFEQLSSSWQMAEVAGAHNHPNNGHMLSYMFITVCVYDFLAMERVFRVSEIPSMLLKAIIVWYLK